MTSQPLSRALFVAFDLGKRRTKTSKLWKFDDRLLHFMQDLTLNLDQITNFEVFYPVAWKRSREISRINDFHGL